MTGFADTIAIDAARTPFPAIATFLNVSEYCIGIL